MIHHGVNISRQQRVRMYILPVQLKLLQFDNNKRSYILNNYFQNQLPQNEDDSLDTDVCAQ